MKPVRKSNDKRLERKRPACIERGSAKKPLHSAP